MVAAVILFLGFRFKQSLANCCKNLYTGVCGFSFLMQFLLLGVYALKNASYSNISIIAPKLHTSAALDNVAFPPATAANTSGAIYLGVPRGIGVLYPSSPVF
jgi:hypothetical protein